ncbi:CPXCG motif-containing cysteine-rich protein [Spongiibacter sp.]|uniref:CPXCG motif-containing cysteine-rich protein n=1 Tax=Spongiibacter sp. TaxID=2024860 RepID=UPI003568DFC3
MSILEVIKQRCPYCAAAIELVVDTSMSGQHYIEDCQVCCRPICIEVLACGGAGEVAADAWAGEVDADVSCQLRLYREDDVLEGRR